MHFRVLWSTWHDIIKKCLTNTINRNFMSSAINLSIKWVNSDMFLPLQQSFAMCRLETKSPTILFDFCLSSCVQHRYNVFRACLWLAEMEINVNHEWKMLFDVSELLWWKLQFFLVISLFAWSIRNICNFGSHRRIVSGGYMETSHDKHRFKVLHSTSHKCHKREGKKPFSSLIWISSNNRWQLRVMIINNNKQLNEDINK